MNAPQQRSVPVLYDTVTLHIFSAADRFDVLVNLFGHRPVPRWCRTVKEEVEAGLNHRGSKESSLRILSQSWLSEHDAPAARDQTKVAKIQLSLSRPGKRPRADLGEAESMVVAMETGGVFVSDDHAAYDMASRRPELGANRVLDSCQILSRAQGESLISAREFRDFHLACAPEKRVMRCRCIFG
jgi:predicted nucleic acid-binding protein